MINILILAAGASSSEGDAKDWYPVCISEMDGIPLIERQIQLCNTIRPYKLIVALKDQEIQKFHLDNIVKLLEPNSVVVPVASETRGAACTALLSCEYIDNEDELLILNGNELLNENYHDAIQHFKKSNCNAGVVTFSSIHPRYSYVRLNDAGFVTESVEKNPISKHAVVGFYWFKKGKDFVQSAKEMIRKEASVNGVFYISPSLNEMVLDGLKIGAFPIGLDKYFPVKTEKQLLKFESSVEPKSK